MSRWKPRPSSRLRAVSPPQAPAPGPSLAEGVRALTAPPFWENVEEALVEARLAYGHEGRDLAIVAGDLKNPLLRSLLGPAMLTQVGDREEGIFLGPCLRTNFLAALASHGMTVPPEKAAADRMIVAVVGATFVFLRTPSDPSAPKGPAS